MDEFRPMLKRLTAAEGLEWRIEGDTIVVGVLASGRKQRIRARREGSCYVFWTVVLGSNAASRTARRRRGLTLQAWVRNAETELVNFTFDGQGRLVGEIRHPREHLDAAELEIYVRILAAEGDRFEYVLTGRDEH